MSWGAIIGAGVSLASTFLKSSAEKDKSEEQAAIASQNAAATQKEAEYQQFRTSVLLRRQAQTTAQVLGAQRAAYAKNGIQLDTGVALKMAESSAAQAAEDAFLIQQEGQFNYERAMAGVNMYQRQASDIATAGKIEAGTTLLTGAWDFAKNFMSS